MIFPKQQQTLKNVMHSELKRQALELIISLYLNRKKDDDIAFLRSNFGQTRQLVSGIRSSIENGLSLDQVESNRLLYGENEKKSLIRCQSFYEILRIELFSIYFILVFVLMFSTFIFGLVRLEKELQKSSSMIFSFYLILIALRITLSYFYSRKLVQTSFEKNKTNVYQVIRSGRIIEIVESEIVVGDILEIGFKQKVPASGLIISEKEIFLRENNENSRIQQKMSLENCIKKIEKMSNLDLKLCFEEQTLPSPVILRGSELAQGSTFSMVVLTVTEQDFLREKKIIKDDDLDCKVFDDWTKSLESHWRVVSLIFLILSSISLMLGNFTDFRLLHNKSLFTFKLVFEVCIRIGVWALIASTGTLNTFLTVNFAKLLISLKITQKLEKLLTLQKIICNEKNVVEHDKIIISNYAVFQKMDVIDEAQFQTLDPVTISIIREIIEIFNLNQCADSKVKDKQIMGKIVHVNKKKTKIVSCVMNPNSQTAILKVLLNEIVRISEKNSGHQGNKTRMTLKLKKSEFERTGSQNCLSVSKGPEKESDQNMIDAIHERCRVRTNGVKTNGLMTSVTQMAKNGFRTYYFYVFDVQKLRDVTHVISNGKIMPISEENKERIKMLARKMHLIYDLIPIMVGYNEGPYDCRPLQVLAGLIGATVSQENKIINFLQEFSHVGIKSIIAVSSSGAHDDEATEQQIIQEYKDRNWISNERDQIYDMQKIKNQLGRLVCHECLISNCDCKNKNEEVSNIQPFLLMSDTMKLVYNVEQENSKYLQRAYSQLNSTFIYIDSHAISAAALVDSIACSLLFIEGLKRSIPLIYCSTMVFFASPLLFWVRGQEILHPLQVGVAFILTQIYFTLSLLSQLNINISSLESYYRKKILIVSKQTTIFIIVLTVLTAIVCQLLFSFHFKIPEYPDPYDDIISQYSLDQNICKYGRNNSVSKNFRTSLCSIPQTPMYSRLSTITITYLYFTLLIFLIAKHKNFKSLFSCFSYVLGIGIFIILIQISPQYLNSYKYGLKWQQWLIAVGLAVVTIVASFLIGYFLSKLSISDYFEEELKNEIVFEQKNENHYLSYLKQYHHEQKWRDFGVDH